MKKRMMILWALVAAMGLAAVAMAAGSQNDPLVSLSYLTGKFTESLNEQVDEALDASDKALTQSLENGEELVPTASTWTEIRLKQEDILSGSTGTMVLPLAGRMRVDFASGAVVDVTAGKALESGAALTLNHRYLVAEDTQAAFIVTDRTAVVDYQGQVSFVHSDAVDYNAMASALKTLHLFKGSFTGYGQGFDLEVAPTRLQALIMFIRVLGEEEEALAWSGTTPFTDIEKGSQAEKYVGYAYSKGYTNGYTKTTFKPAGAVNAYQYTEFVLRAMGYSSAQNTSIGDALVRARTAGVLTEGEAAMLQTTTFLRADLVYISYYALGAYLPDGTVTLGDLLQVKGVFTDEEWRAALEMVPGERI